MSELDQILAQLPMSQIAAQLGVDESEVHAAARDALPALLGGLQANIGDEAGALSLGQALEQHDPGLLGSDLDAIDVQDGDKIIAHILGDQRQDVIAQLGGGRSGGSGMIGKLLPILAPIVLSYLAGKLRERGGLGGVLGDVVGGAASPGGQPRSGGSAGEASGAGDGGLGDILGGVLGGGGSGGGLGDILGQVLGGADSPDAGPARSGSGMPGGGLPEEPTGPLIPTDGGEPADVTRGGRGDGGPGSGAAGGGLGGVLGDILGQVLGGGGGGRR